MISIKEEIEQSIINSTVKIDRQTATSTATLPFIADPVTRLANNKDKATTVNLQQIRKLNLSGNQKDKQDVLESEAKLQQLGYVDYLRNLPLELQSKLQSAKILFHYLESSIERQLNKYTISDSVRCITTNLNRFQSKRCPGKGQK